MIINYQQIKLTILAIMLFHWAVAEFRPGPPAWSKSMSEFRQGGGATTSEFRPVHIFLHDFLRLRTGRFAGMFRNVQVKDNRVSDANKIN